MNTSEDYRKYMELQKRAREKLAELSEAAMNNFRDRNRLNRINRRWKKLWKRRRNRGARCFYKNSIIDPWWYAGMNVIEEPLWMYFEKRKMEFGSTQPKEQ